MNIENLLKREGIEIPTHIKIKPFTDRIFEAKGKRVIFFKVFESGRILCGGILGQKFKEGSRCTCYKNSDNFKTLMEHVVHFASIPPSRPFFKIWNPKRMCHLIQIKNPRQANLEGY